MPDRVKYDATADDWLVWRYPSEELAFGTTVIVHDSQYAVFVQEGRVGDILGHGRHVLSTGNLPLLSRYLKRAFDGKTPFPAEVWFVNRRCKGGLRWGTGTPVPFVDPVHRVPVQLRAYGTWEVEVRDPALLLRTLVGTLPFCTAERIRDHFEAEIVRRFSEVATTMLAQGGRSVVDAAALLGPLGERIAAALRPAYEKVGLDLRALTVQSVSVPESDLARLRSKPSVEERLREAKRLREEGLISADEHEARRRRILADG